MSDGRRHEEPMQSGAPERQAGVLGRTSQELEIVLAGKPYRPVNAVRWA